MLGHKVDASLPNLIGRTPLHSAAAEGHSEVAKLLLEGVADPTVTDYLGLIPELLTCHNDHCDLVKLFTQRGVAIDDRPAFRGIEAGSVDDVAFLVVTFWAGKIVLTRLLETETVCKTRLIIEALR